MSTSAFTGGSQVPGLALHSPPWIKLNWHFCLAIPNKSCRPARAVLRLPMLCTLLTWQTCLSSPSLPRQLYFPRDTATAHHLRATGDTETSQVNVRTWGREYSWVARSKRPETSLVPQLKPKSDILLSFLYKINFFSLAFLCFYLYSSNKTQKEVSFLYICDSAEVLRCGATSHCYKRLQKEHGMCLQLL